MTNLKYYEELKNDIAELIRIHKLLDVQLGGNVSVTFICIMKKLFLGLKILVFYQVYAGPSKQYTPIGQIK